MKPIICKEERICKNCDLDEVEDESHFLLKCPLYCQQRTTLMTTILSYTTSESQEELFIILMKSRESTVIKALGKYIYCFQDEGGTYVSALARTPLNMKYKF